MAALVSGCAGWTGSSVGEELPAQTVELPEVHDMEERVQEESIVASSAPPQMEFTPEEPKLLYASTEAQDEPFLDDPIAPPVVLPADLIGEDEFPPLGPFLLDIPFNFDRSGLRDDALMFLEVNAIRLSDEEVAVVLLEGRGDEVGTTDYNLVLGERRARAVKQYLLSLGLDASRLLITSYGKERPLCAEHNIDCWQLNRSVRFVVKD